MSHFEPTGPAEGPSKLKWEAIVSSFVAIATLVFGVFTWWDARTHPKADEPAKVVAVVKPEEVGAAKTAEEKKATVAAQDPREAPQPLSTSQGKRIYHYRNVPLDRPDSRIEKAVIVIPAAASQALSCFKMMREAAQAEGQAHATLVLVPIFREAPEDLLADEHLWAHTWEIGAPSSDRKPISSFLVLDELYAKLSDPDTFPNLRSVVLVGRHAGAIFINRYVALGNPIIAPRSGGAKVEDRYVILSPGIYLYLDRYRPVRRTDKFAVPKADDCPDFDQYPFGLANRPRYLRPISEHTIRENVFSRRAVYMVGNKDTGTRGMVDSCQAKAQGVNRWRRAHFYWLYIQRFPEWKDNAEYKEMDGVAGFNDQIYTSQEVREVVFGPPNGGPKPKVARR